MKFLSVNADSVGIVMNAGGRGKDAGSTFRSRDSTCTTAVERQEEPEEALSFSPAWAGFRSIICLPKKTQRVIFDEVWR
jgi:hypothetical protein